MWVKVSCQGESYGGGELAVRLETKLRTVYNRRPADAGPATEGGVETNTNVVSSSGNMARRLRALRHHQHRARDRLRQPGAWEGLGGGEGGGGVAVAPHHRLQAGRQLQGAAHRPRQPEVVRHRARR